MTKIAFVFPGQGAQYLGMGKELFDNHTEAKHVFDMASNRLGQDVAKLCFEGPEEELKKTENTQPAILTVSAATAAIFEAEGIKPFILAGLSLGEYSALVSAHSIGFEDAVSLVTKRAQFMQIEVPLGQGGMAVIVGLSKEKVEECCAVASAIGIVEPSCFNSQQQISISGHTDAIASACEHAKLLGAKQVIKLPVSAPFHSSLLKGAGEKLAAELEKTKINIPKVQVVSNYSAHPYSTVSEIQTLLRNQVSHAVRWYESIQYMIAQGADTFIELGPGRVLSGLIRKISPGTKTFNVEDEASLRNTLSNLNRSVA